MHASRVFSNPATYMPYKTLVGEKFWLNNSHQKLAGDILANVQTSKTTYNNNISTLTSQLESSSTPMAHGYNQTLYCTQVNT